MTPGFKVVIRKPVGIPLFQTAFVLDLRANALPHLPLAAEMPHPALTPPAHPDVTRGRRKDSSRFGPWSRMQARDTRVTECLASSCGLATTRTDSYESQRVHRWSTSLSVY